MDPNTRFREISPAPEHEAKRLREVRRLTPLARQAKNQLQLFCRIAAEIFGAPMAAVTLVDETELRILASQGPVATPIPRERSLCSCVILQRDPFIVRDLEAEMANLRDVPHRNGFPLRFYAAIPLATWTGQNVGTLFVADVHPHEVSDGQVGALSGLAQLAMLEIERQVPVEAKGEGIDPSESLEDQVFRLIARGAAHDFGELITGWIGSVDALEKELLPGSEEHELAGQLSRSLIPAARLTDHLKFFAGAIHDPVDALPLNQLVESALKMLRHVVQRGIDIQVRRDRAVDGMKMDTRDLELALAVLVYQADQAMPEGGEITVSTGVERFDEQVLTPFLDLPADLYATVTIAHSGNPLSAEERRQLLEANARGDAPSSPLALAAHIVARTGGGIDLCSVPDFGESVTLYLPVIWRPLPPDAASIEEGKLHILLVENHEVVLRGVYSALRRRGYRVTTAENGAEALRKFPSGEGFDMVVTDVVMHPVDGVEMVEKFREKRPSLLVVFMSGYDKVGVDPRRLPERTRFLAKPFTADALVDQVASLLPDRSSGA